MIESIKGGVAVVVITIMSLVSAAASVVIFGLFVSFCLWFTALVFGW